MCDGRWHYLDSFLKFYVRVPDPKAPGGWTIAGEEDIKANPALVRAGLELDRGRGVYYHKGNRFENRDGKANWRAPSFLSCGDTPILSEVFCDARHFPLWRMRL